MLIKIKKADMKKFRSVQGHFDAISTDGKIFIIGGAVRSIIFGGTISDYDFTIIGGTAYEFNFRTFGRHRVEVDHCANQIESLEEYFLTRDFTINQIAIDSKGVLYCTQEALDDARNRILRPVHPNSLSIREGARAIRFSQEYDLTPVNSLREFCRVHRKEIKEERVYRRYLREKKITPKKWFGGRGGDSQ